MGIPDVPYSLIEHALQVPLRQSRALEVLLSLDFLCDNDGLSELNWGHFLLPQALFGCLILSEIQLSADQYNRDAGRVVINFWVPLSSGQFRAAMADFNVALPLPSRCRMTAG